MKNEFQTLVAEINSLAEELYDGYNTFGIDFKAEALRLGEKEKELADKFGYAIGRHGRPYKLSSIKG